MSHGFVTASLATKRVFSRSSLGVHRQNGACLSRFALASSAKVGRFFGLRSGFDFKSGAFSLCSLFVRLDGGGGRVCFAAAPLHPSGGVGALCFKVFFYSTAPPPYKGGGGRGGINLDRCIFVHLFFSPPSVLYRVAKKKNGKNKGLAVQKFFFRHQAFYIGWRKRKTAIGRVAWWPLSGCIVSNRFRRVFISLAHRHK